MANLFKVFRGSKWGIAVVVIGAIFWVVGRIRDVEYISEKIKDPSWQKAVIDFVENTSLWLSPVLILCGFAILLTIRRHTRQTEPNSLSQPQESRNGLSKLEVSVTITNNFDGTQTASIHSPQTRYDPAMKTFVKFKPKNIVEITDSYNVVSVTDNGISEFTITFDSPLDDEEFTCSASGTGTVNFEMIENSRDFARIVFTEPLPEVVQLTFE